MEKPLRFERMSGLDEEQLDELEKRVAELLEMPWNKRIGRPREGRPRTITGPGVPGEGAATPPVVDLTGK
jgi:hypothetical protein